MGVMPCRALGIFCEDDDDELHRRQDAINKSMDLDYADLENMRWYSGVGHDNAMHYFMRDDWSWEASEFFQLVHNLASDNGYQLIVLDSLHDLFAGNENNRSEVRKFVQMLHRLALDIDGTVVLSAHPSKAGRADGSGESGSTAWNNSVRSRLYLSQLGDDEDDEPDPDIRELARMKSNYSKRGESIKLRWKDGAMVLDGEPLSGAVGAIQSHNIETVFMRLLGELTSEKRPVSDNYRAGNYAPKVFFGRPRADREGFNLKEFSRAMEALFAAGKIEIQGYGPPSKGWKQIAKTGAPIEQEILL